MERVASDAIAVTDTALKAVPIVVGGSTIFGYSWSDFVNVLASISIGLQIVWFMYDKARTLKERHVKDRSE